MRTPRRSENPAERLATASRGENPVPAPMQLRVARHTGRLAEVVAFYRDCIGLPELGRFVDHDGYDGVFLDVPGTDTHLELTSGGSHGTPTPHVESLLVLYLPDQQSRDAIIARMPGLPVAAANPYWARHGVTFEDPDGFRVVLVPERWSPTADPPDCSIERYDGQRSDLLDLFRLAEDSPQRLRSNLGVGQVMIARHGDETVGLVQVTAGRHDTETEILSIAVKPTRRRQGIGRALVEAAARLARDEARETLVVATATADLANLRFYLRLGFRMRSVEPDAFTVAAGYPPGLRNDGIEVRDRVWFERRP